MNERRRSRSESKIEALALLLAAVRERSAVSSVALVDEAGQVVSGVGSAQELVILGAVAQPAVRGALSPLCERLTEGTDILATPVRTPIGTMFLAALGERVGRMSDAARGVERILRAA